MGGCALHPLILHTQAPFWYDMRGLDLSRRGYALKATGWPLRSTRLLVLHCPWHRALRIGGVRAAHLAPAG
jgi:hypothetical protein